MLLDKNHFEIKYKPLFHGADNTKIKFLDGELDLNTLFTNTKIKPQNSSRRLFVTDTKVITLEPVKKFFESVQKSERDIFFVVPTGEENKTINTVLSIVECALTASFTRKDIFVAIGGGVITDMTAFAASIYKRGTRTQSVPTTLLAMVDAAVGGKTGCDFNDYKNMIGSFFPAEKIFIFPQFVQTQSNEQYFSGLAEVIKTALLFNKNLFNLIVVQKEKILERDKKIIFNMITECVKDKARIVQKDLTEKNIRMTLNFGHTFAHALETCVGLGKITHGAAVAWGISRALVVSKNLGLCNNEYLEKVFNVLKFFGYNTGTALNFGLEKKSLLCAMRRDKKNSSSTIRLILQKGLCKTIIQEVQDDEILKAL